MPFVNETKPTVVTTSIAAGTPIGLLLSLTYAMSVGFITDTKPSTSYSNVSKP